jgi:hypothetical protein
MRNDSRIAEVLRLSIPFFEPFSWASLWHSATLEKIDLFINQEAIKKEQEIQ